MVFILEIQFQLLQKEYEKKQKSKSKFNWSISYIGYQQDFRRFKIEGKFTQFSFDNIIQSIYFYKNSDMPEIPLEKIRALMNNQDSIRNICIISHDNLGDCSIHNFLATKHGIKIIDEEPEQEQKTTTRITSQYLHYKSDTNKNKNEVKNEYLINLISCPRNTYFNYETIAALRVADGVLFVVNYSVRIGIQIQFFLKQAMVEKIKPILFINKVDFTSNGFKLDGETIYQNLIKTINQVNSEIGIYNQHSPEDFKIQPSKGNVAFGSVKQKWVFTLYEFARIYNKKFGISTQKMMQKLWGDNYYDTQQKKWKFDDQSSLDTKPLKRAFVQFIMNPICKLYHAVIDGQPDVINKMLTTLQIKLLEEQQKVVGGNLFKLIMSRWLSAENSLLQMSIFHLPSPKTSQSYRTEHLYKGPQNDLLAVSMKNCDPKGPLMVYITKMIPTNEKGKFFAFGRVFSGTVTSGQKVKIMGNQHKFGSKVDVYEKNIYSVAIMVGRTAKNITDVPCGNAVALFGIDQYILKTATISDHWDAHIIRPLKQFPSQFLKIRIRPENYVDLPKLIEGLKKLSKSDLSIECKIEETGEMFISSSEDFHAELCINELQKFYAQCGVIKQDPVVIYKETVIGMSLQPNLSKSQNKHNRFYGVGEYLANQLSQTIQKAQLEFLDNTQRAEKLVKQFSWQKQDAIRIICFGPNQKGPNILVDKTEGIQYMSQINPFLNSSFQACTKNGVLIQQSLRGFRCNIVDIVYYFDAIHRGGGQIIPAARRLFYACELTSTPCILQPILYYEVKSAPTFSKKIAQCFINKRGCLIDQQRIEQGQFSIVSGLLPAQESIGFFEIMKDATKGDILPHNISCIMDHWQLVDGLVLTPDSRANRLVKKIRISKGLKEQIPPLDCFIDKN